MKRRRSLVKAEPKPGSMHHAASNWYQLTSFVNEYTEKRELRLKLSYGIDLLLTRETDGGPVTATAIDFSDRRSIEKGNEVLARARGETP